MSQTFTVENFKGVREITLSPEGSLVVVAGGNGAGKSSFIDAFVELFDPKGTRLTPKPIREGEDEARAEFVDTDLDIRVVRTWKKNDAGRLEVFALDGAKYGKPAEVVAKLTGGLIFDPVAFLNLDEKRQRDALLAKVDLPFDIDEVAREKAGAEQRRLEAGRDVKRLEGALASLPKPAPGTPAEEVSSQDILDEIEAAHSARDRRHRVEAYLAEAEEDVELYTRKLEQAKARVAQSRQTVAALPEPVDVEPLREKLASVEETNAAVRTLREHARVSAELAAAANRHVAAQADIDAVEAKKAAGLAAATFPVEGLSVDETGVTFDGVPFVQVNTATRLRVAFGIATAGSPDLKLVIARMGDMLDDASLAAVREMAEARGYTVLMERDRDSSREIGFTIREGVLDASA